MCPGRNAFKDLEDYLEGGWVYLPFCGMVGLWKFPQEIRRKNPLSYQENIF